MSDYSKRERKKEAERERGRKSDIVEEALHIGMLVQIIDNGCDINWYDECAHIKDYNSEVVSWKMEGSIIVINVILGCFLAMAHDWFWWKQSFVQEESSSMLE